MNLGEMFKQAKDIQARATEMQEKLAVIEAEGVSGAGMVVLTLNGKSELKQLKLAPSLVKPENAQMIEDLVIAAHADAKTKLERKIAEAMQKLSREMGIPAGLGG